MYEKSEEGAAHPSDKSDFQEITSCSLQKSYKRAFLAASSERYNTQAK